MKIQIGNWFIADIIGLGIYEMVEHGVNRENNYYAIVKCKKLFGKGFIDKDHETCCHPITNIDKWNHFKRLK